MARDDALLAIAEKLTTETGMGSPGNELDISELLADEAQKEELKEILDEIRGNENKNKEYTLNHLRYKAIFNYNSPKSLP